MSASEVIMVDDPARLGAEAARLLAAGFRLALVAGHDDGPAGIRVVYVFVAGPPDRRIELHLRSDRLPSLARLSFPASRFEREVRDLYGIEIDGHPMPAPLVHHPHWPAAWHPMRRDAGSRPALEAGRPLSFVPVAGDGVYEVPVGPIHAGIIEPGHFRFWVVGETVLKLKARLWYVHKGIEKLAEGRDIEGGLPLVERISGDTAVGHALAYSLAVEDALDVRVPVEAALARIALLELERLHHHVTDIGALANDVAFGIANAHTLRIRERLLRLNQQVTGHRLLRGGIFPGGAALLSVPAVETIAAVAADLAEIVEIVLGHSVVRDRFTGTGVLTRAQAEEIGTVGYVARASGLSYDARIAHPIAGGPERGSEGGSDLGLDLAGLVSPGPRSMSSGGGDVLARFTVRADEAAASAAILAAVLPRLRPGRSAVPLPSAPTPRAGVGIAEGWRGAIAHRVELGCDGRLRRLKVVDPSFLNWPAVPVAMAETIVPDFPLTNKSFNLSYAGNDL